VQEQESSQHALNLALATRLEPTFGGEGAKLLKGILGQLSATQKLTHRSPTRVGAATSAGEW
jgi:hypothetical protein